MTTEGLGVVVLLSGGLDSTVALAWARHEWPGARLHALTLEYGQRHWIEVECARDVVAALGAPAPTHKTMSMGPAGNGVRSLLTMVNGRPVATDADALVPGRNLMMLIYAAAYAQARDCSTVVIGCNADDAASFPDCRPEALAPMQAALRRGLDWDGAIAHPFTEMSKGAVARLGFELGAADAMAASWSCYQPVAGAAPEARPVPVRRVPRLPEARRRARGGHAVRTTITRSYELQCAHALPRVDQETHKCARTHGHTWLVEVTVGGELDPHMGWAMDFAELDAVWGRRVHDVIDHRNLNDFLPNPTTELLCQWIVAQLVPSLPDLVAVSACENRRARVTVTL